MKTFLGIAAVLAALCALASECARQEAEAVRDEAMLANAAAWAEAEKMRDELEFWRSYNSKKGW